MGAMKGKAMYFALRYKTPNNRIITTAWQHTISRVRDMADFYENQGCEIISFMFKGMENAN